MAPRFPRTRKLAQPLVMAVVDGLFAVLWLSAFAAQAAYNTANLCGGACGQSKAIVAMGFFVLFVCPFPPYFIYILFFLFMEVTGLTCWPKTASSSAPRPS